ncbi:MAG: TetR/AcrR family transcriptional regulator [Bacteroidia bacterium]
MAKRKYAEIIQAAAKVFAEKGFYGASMQDIAQELGMNKSSLYYYVKAKEDLVKGLVEGVLQDILKEAREVMETGHDPAAKLRLIIEAHLRQFLAHRSAFAVFLHENPALLDRFSQADVQRVMKDYDALLVGLIEEGQANGTFRADLDPKITVFGIFGMCNYTSKWYHAEGSIKGPEVARVFAEIALHGVIKS